MSQTTAPNPNSRNQANKNSNNNNNVLSNENPLLSNNNNTMPSQANPNQTINGISNNTNRVNNNDLGGFATTSLSEVPLPRTDHSLVNYEGLFYVYGGRDETHIFADIFEFNPITHQWRDIKVNYKSVNAGGANNSGVVAADSVG